jgi:hypothetical protein
MERWSRYLQSYNTGLGRLSAIQQAFQAVELPPDAITLHINHKILADDPTTPSNSVIIDGSVPPITTT